MKTPIRIATKTTPNGQGTTTSLSLIENSQEAASASATPGDSVFTTPRQAKAKSTIRISKKGKQRGKGSKDAIFTDALDGTYWKESNIGETRR